MHDQPAHAQDERRRWLALALVCSTSLMIVLDATIVNVALPAIQQDLGFSGATLAWVVNAYLLTFGGLMLLGGRAADLLGRRRVLMTGIALFTLASLVCGLAGSQVVLVVARAVQGIGGAIVSSVSLSIVVALFPEPGERAKAMSIWGFVGSGAGSVGVIAGGILTQTLSWHWIFLVNVPIGAVVLLLARPLLPPTRGIGLANGLDLPGTLAVMAAPMLAVFGIVNGEQAGWTSATTLAPIGLAIAVGLAFVAIERRQRAPLVPLRLFRSRLVVATNAITVLSGAAFFGWFFFSPLYARNILGFDSLQTGATFLPATLAMMVLSLGLAARIVARYGPRLPLVGGMFLFALGLLLLARTPVDGSFVRDLLPAMLVLGVAAGVSFMPLFLIATAEAAPADSGLVSGLISTSQMIGGAIGLAVLAGIAAIRSGALLDTGVETQVALNEGYHAAFIAGAVLSLITTVIGVCYVENPKVAVPAAYDDDDYDACDPPTPEAHAPTAM